MGNPHQACQTGWTHPHRPHWGTVWSLVSTRSGSCLECWYSWRCVGTGCPRCYTHQYLHRRKKERNSGHQSLAPLLSGQSRQSACRQQERKYDGSILAPVQLRRSLADCGWLKVRAGAPIRSHYACLYKVIIHLWKGSVNSPEWTTCKSASQTVTECNCIFVCVCLYWLVGVI